MPDPITPARWSAPTPGLPKHLAARGFRFFSAPADLGGGEGGAPTPPPPAPVPTPPVPAPPAPPAPAASGTGAAENVADLPAWAQALISNTRAEAAAARVGAKESAAQEARDALVQDLGKALGLVQDGDPTPDPAALTAQLAEQATTARNAQVELAVYRAAAGVGADPQALLDSRTVLDSLATVDPTDTAAITAAITKAVTDNPRLKVAPAATRSSVNLTGGPGENNKTPLSLDAAVAAAMTQ